MSEELRFGDPIGCHYPHAEPSQVETYGDAVRGLGAKVGTAETAFRTTASMPAESFSGEAADALRARAGRRLEEADDLGRHLRAVGRAVADHADFLRRHRDALESLRDLAVSRGLRVEGHRIWPPVETISGDATRAELDAWEQDWKSYQECFEGKRAIIEARQEAGRALVKVMAEHTGVRPEDVREKRDGGRHGRIDFADERREAATQAAEAVAARDDLQAARGTVDRLTARYDRALDELERLLLADAPAEELLAQSGRVQLIDRELDGARSEAREAADTFRQEQRESNQAARALQDAEGPGPHLAPSGAHGEVVQGNNGPRPQVEVQAGNGPRPQVDSGLAPVRDLRDRLG